MGLPNWLSHRLPALAQLWDRLIWSSFILDVHGDSTLLTVQVGLLDQLFFASVSGSVTTKTPSFRRRSTLNTVSVILIAVAGVRFAN